MVSFAWIKRDASSERLHDERKAVERSVYRAEEAKGEDGPQQWKKSLRE